MVQTSSPTSRPTRRTDPRVTRTTEVILRAAHRLLVTEGVEAVSFNRLSRETGVSRTTLYRHWAAPIDVVRAAWNSGVPVNDTPPTDDLRADLLELTMTLRDAIDGDELGRALASVVHAAHRDPVVGQMHAEFVEQRRAPFVARVGAAVDRGELASGTDPDLVADLLAGRLFYRHLLRHSQTDDHEVRSLVDIVLAGVGWSGDASRHPTIHDRSVPS